MTKNLNNIIFLIILVSIVMFDMCDRRMENNTHLNDIKSVMEFNDREKDQVIKDTNLKAEEVEVMKQNLMSEKAANELLKEELSMYNKINSYVKAELVTAINNLRIDFPGVEEAIPERLLSNDSTMNIDTVKKYFVKVPKLFNYSDKQWFSLSGSVDKKGILFDTIQFINKLDVTIGYKKGKRFYNKSQPTVELKSYNPYTSVPYINNIVVNKEKTPWYSSRLAFFGYGMLSGYGISKLKTN